VSDLFKFGNNTKQIKTVSYTASDIEVLEGLEPVRKRPGMYIGGVDESAMHHLVSEVLDNSMDEAVAGFASRITIEILADVSVAISDNGRGIPIDNHPKFPKKSALEVIMTTLHSGGKFSDKSYQTAGGLHGVGISVVNALSDRLQVEVFREGNVFSQNYERGVPKTKLEKKTAPKKLRGTRITFNPDPEIFGKILKLKPKRIFELAKSKAYLYKGVEIHWLCSPEVIAGTDVPEQTVIHFPNGLKDYLDSKISREKIISGEIFSGSTEIKSESISIEWAICWGEHDGFIQSYCNTIPTPQGGTHEQGSRAALLRSIKIYGEATGQKKVQQIIADDILESVCLVLSIFIKDPVFQGQTKEKLVSAGVTKHVENMIKDHFDHWLSGNKKAADIIVQHIIDNAEYRLNRKNERVSRKTATQKLRLPGKLADCSRSTAHGTELFLVEGDSAGGSAKQARDRETQAILPLRGKILNVANAPIHKISANQEIQDLEIALACGSMNHYKEENLRYEKIIIMTDADVDGAHIASLLMTFFYLRMQKLIQNGHLYLACPPLYRLTQNNKTYYAGNDEEKQLLIEKLGKSKIEIGRFKGLGEMTPKQLKETTMDPKTRTLYQVNIDDIENIDKIVDDLMGKKPEKRFKFIHEQALARKNLIDELYI
jgi:topoisomerase-4 subunit B